MNKKNAFIAEAKSLKKTDTFGANSDTNVTFVGQILRLAHC